MSKVKRCVQCGLLKEEEDFRKYTYSRTNDTEGRYRLCKSCEAINASYRRAKTGLPNIAEAMYNIDKIDKLYATLKARGLRVPTTTDSDEPDAVDKLLAFYEDPANNKTLPAVKVVIPDELQEWLDAPMSVWKDANISPEYLQETVYESLKAKYRPQVGVDRTTFLPIYDDTYKEVLNNILRRFDDYEEEESSKEP